MKMKLLFMLLVVVGTANGLAAQRLRTQGDVNGHNIINLKDSADLAIAPEKIQSAGDIAALTTAPPSTAPCGSSGLISTSGANVTSPGWPAKYENSASCSAQAIASEGQVIRLSFYAFDLEYSANCSYDKLVVYDGDSPASPIIAYLCGPTIPSPIYSSGPSMYMEFSSDVSVTSAGFHGTLTFIDESDIPTPAPTTPTMIPPTTNSAPTSECGSGVPVTISGTKVTSPGWPGTYPQDSDCKTYVVSSADEIVELSFSSFDVEHSDGCRFDKLVVYDGNSTASPVITSLCGDEIPSAVYSSGPLMTMQFISDGFVSYDGYLGTVTFMNELPPPPSVGCDSVKTAPTGDITTPGYPGQYPTHEECATLIHSEDPRRTVTLTFNSFDVEEDPSCSYDYVAVYDGTDAAAPELGKFCGTSLPSPVTSTGPDMFVKFFSDATMVGFGVHASYVIV